MGLLISRNGAIGDYSRSKDQSKPQNNSRVQDQSNQGQSKGKDKHQERGNKNPYQQALNSYRDQKPENTKAKSIASLIPITAKVECSVEQAITIMKKNGIHHLLYVDENMSVIGILSDRDILDKRRSDVALDFATREVIVAKEATDIKIICSLMIDKLVSAVPLIDEKGQLSGIVTKTDILEYAFKSHQLEVYV
jgi:CBS domain-containing protein